MSAEKPVGRVNVKTETCSATVVDFPRLHAPTYLHHVEGRLRLQGDGLRNADALEAVRRRLSTVAGLKTVQTNGLIGSITIQYDPDRLTSDELLHVLRLCGLRPGNRPAPSRQAAPHWASSLAGTVLESLAKILLEAAVKRVATAVLLR